MISYAIIVFGGFEFNLVYENVNKVCKCLCFFGDVRLSSILVFSMKLTAFFDVMVCSVFLMCFVLRNN